MSKKATIIAVVNQKGGTGKTTTTENLGVGLALEGKKVLLVDTDPQASLTVSLGNPCPDDLSPTLSDLMGKIMMEYPIAPGEGILHHPEGVDLVPSNIELSGMEVALVNAMSRETILRQYLDTVKQNYDYILLDCMPSLGMLTVNALAAADNVLIPDDPDSKPNACVGNVLRIWQDGQADKLTQLVFCDLSTPKNDGTFNVYDDVKTKLIANGVPAEEVAFIHDADTEAKKKDLFAKVRTGQVRVLLGSTQKMGAGTNVQDKLVAVHHLDVGWRPSDMTQRNGRIIRQGNRNKEVQVYQYVTEGTFDAYLYPCTI